MASASRLACTKDVGNVVRGSSLIARDTVAPGGELTETSVEGGIGELLEARLGAILHACREDRPRTPILLLLVRRGDDVDEGGTEQLSVALGDLHLGVLLVERAGVLEQLLGVAALALVHQDGQERGDDHHDGHADRDDRQTGKPVQPFPELLLHGFLGRGPFPRGVATYGRSAPPRPCARLGPLCCLTTEKRRSG